MEPAARRDAPPSFEMPYTSRKISANTTARAAGTNTAAESTSVTPASGPLRIGKAFASVVPSPPRLA